MALSFRILRSKDVLRALETEVARLQLLSPS